MYLLSGVAVRMLQAPYPAMRGRPWLNASRSGFRTFVVPFLRMLLHIRAASVAYKGLCLEWLAVVQWQAEEMAELRRRIAARQKFEMSPWPLLQSGGD